MISKRQSTLDGGLYELMRADSDADLLLSDSFEQPAAATTELERPLTSRSRATRPTATLPSQKVTVKLIKASASEDDGTDEAGDTLADKLAGLDCDIVSRGPQVLLANVPRNRLEALGSLPELRRVEQPRRLQFRLEDARGPSTRADLGLAQHPAIRGQGVVVGIMDSGTDWRHADFRRPGGETRMEMFMHAIHDNVSGTDSFEEFSAQDIDAALNGGGSVPDGDLDGHGTHCASIAAGNGLASANQKFRGLAPEATLMAVRSDTLHDTHIIEAIRRIFDRAGNRPAVINLSLGGHIGPHDGTSALENVISRESGPGRIIVVASGNEAEHRIHFEGQLVAGQNLDIEFTIRDDVQFLDVWIPRGDEADITVIDHDGTETVPDGSIQETSAGAFRADLREDQFNRDINFSLAVAGNQLGRRWRVRMKAQLVRHGTVHAWAQARDSRFSRSIFMSETSPRYSIGMPATEERAISVASFISRSSVRPGGTPVTGLVEGRISPFSSNGPARHGAQRPDIAAPGQHIAAALAANSDMADAAHLAPNRLPGGQYIAIQGTSMATPFVTGVIALMLQQEPNLSPEDIQLRLRATAQRDADTGQVWNPAFGYGKIDVEALLGYSVTV